jgi:hypothetical protein
MFSLFSVLSLFSLFPVYSITKGSEEEISIPWEEQHISISSGRGHKESAEYDDEDEDEFAVIVEEETIVEVGAGTVGSLDVELINAVVDGGAVDVFAGSSLPFDLSFSFSFALAFLFT